MYITFNKLVGVGRGHFLTIVLILVAVLIMIDVGPCGAQTSTQFEQLILQAKRGGEYIAPTSAELIKAEDLFRRLFRGERNDELIKTWGDLGFEWMEIIDNGKQIQVLREKPDQKLGRGFYAFQAMHKGNAIEAPHTFSDLHTGEIAAKLFLYRGFSAGAWSTVHRRQADMAHMSSSYFMAFSRAFILEMPKRYIIQLHGFSQEKRETPVGLKANIVLSNGHSLVSRELDELRACIQQDINENVYIYPREITELGATTNSIGTQLNAIDPGHFIHIELSAFIRTTLLMKPTLLQTFEGCLP